MFSLTDLISQIRNLSKTIFICHLFLGLSFITSGQKRYTSLLWKISGNGLKKPSYLYGTMHVSSKVAYHLSDQFYEAIKSADVVGLESDPSKWLGEMDKYHILNSSNRNNGLGYFYQNFYSDAFALRIHDEKLYSSMISFDPEIINSLLFRKNLSNENFEESTYIDLFIYQTGTKWGKKIVSLEDFRASLIMSKLSTSPDIDPPYYYDEERDYSSDYFNEAIEDSYRKGDLDQMDSLNHSSVKSKNYWKFLINDRNATFSQRMDSIMQTQSIFAGMGAAHLPGENGVIELLRRKGYTIEPVIQTSSNKTSSIKKKLDLTFQQSISFKQFASDSLFSFSAPGKLVDIFDDNYNNIRVFADMVNGAFYTIVRIKSFGPLLGRRKETMHHRIDSILYESIPGKIISKEEIKNSSGFLGFDILNETIKGDFQRYQIYISDLEIIIFKLGGKSEYVKNKVGKDFFNSISFTPVGNDYNTFSPKTGGFEVNLPDFKQYEKYNGALEKGISEFLASFDQEKRIFYGVTHCVYHDVTYIEEDTFELGQLSRNALRLLGLKEKNEWSIIVNEKYPCITFSGESSSTNERGYGKIYINGSHYYMAYAVGPLNTVYPEKFFSSFKLVPFNFIYTFENINDPTMFFEATDEISSTTDDAINKEVAARYEEMLKNKKTKDPDLSFDKIDLEKYYYSYSSQDKVTIVYAKCNDYEYVPETEFWANIRKNILSKTTQKISREQFKDEKNGIKTLSFLLTDTGSVRGIWYKGIRKSGVYYEVYALADTLIGLLGWQKDFFASIRPKDTTIGKNVFEYKFNVLLKDLMSADSTTRRKAEISLPKVYFYKEYAGDFISFINQFAFNGLSEAVKAQLLVSGGEIESSEIISPYKKMYKQYEDSSFLQLCLIKGLGIYKSKESYAAIKEMLTLDPPLTSDESAVLNVFDVFYDSLELSKNFYPDLLSLTRFPEYKRAVFKLLATLVDKKIIYPAQYASSLQNLIIESNYELKRFNSIQDESRNNKSYTKAEQIQQAINNIKDDIESNLQNSHEQPDVFVFVTLLTPFYKTEGVKNFITKLSKTNDADLLVSVYVELLKNDIPINDSIWNHFASKIETRAILYNKLKKLNQLTHFPKEFSDQQSLCESVIQNYLTKIHNYYGLDKKDRGKPETLTFYKAIDVKNKQEKGKIYIFQREETYNKEERWACTFVQESKEPVAEMEVISLNLILNKGKSTDDYINELIENFSLKYRWRSYSYDERE